jgi:hypothetical protein
VTRIMYASGVVPMTARNAVVGLIEVADGRSRSALLYGYNSGLERVNLYVLLLSVSRNPNYFPPRCHSAVESHTTIKLCMSQMMPHRDVLVYNIARMPALTVLVQPQSTEGFIRCRSLPIRKDRPPLTPRFAHYRKPRLQSA